MVVAGEAVGQGLLAGQALVGYGKVAGLAKGAV